MYVFVEVATKMVEYGVIYLSENVEVLFVVLSKFIPSWLIFLDGQVKYIQYIFGIVWRIKHSISEGF